MHRAHLRSVMLTKPFGVAPSIIDNPRRQREEARCTRQTNEIRKDPNLNTGVCDRTVSRISGMKPDLPVSLHSETVRRTGAEARRSLQDQAVRITSLLS